jgi:hypothetical protein
VGHEDDTERVVDEFNRFRWLKRRVPAARSSKARKPCSISLQLAACAMLLLTAGLSACTGEQEKAALPAISKALHYVAESHVQGGQLSEVAAGLGSLVDNYTAIRPKLDQIAASDDPFGKALVTATCYGLSNIAQQQQETDQDLLPPSVETWETFLEDELAALLPDEAADAIHTRVEQFNNAAGLAQINPRAAQVYVQECALRKS